MALSTTSTDILEQLASRSEQAIKMLIQSAELTRTQKAKKVNYLDAFFKQAKKHIA